MRTDKPPGRRRGLRRLKPRRPEERAAMSLLEHLEELRRRLMWTALAVGIAAIAGWFLFDRIIELLLAPARPYLLDITDGQLIVTGPFEAFGLRLKVAFYMGFAIAFPVVLFQIWRFVSPGLHKNERRYAIPFIASGILLFAAGVRFAFYTMPQALRFLIGPEVTGGGVSPLLSARPYLDFALLYHVAFGLAFEFPVLLILLAMIRVITSRQMARYRRHVFVACAVAAAILTPPDPFSMIVLTPVLYVLYEASIWIARLLKR